MSPPWVRALLTLQSTLHPSLHAGGSERCRWGKGTAQSCSWKKSDLDSTPTPATLLLLTLGQGSGITLYLRAGS